MKRLIVSIIFLFSLASFVHAGDVNNLKLSEVTANMGKGAFTSGFDVNMKFNSEKNAIEVAGNHERAYAVLFWKLPLKITAGICAGVFKNMPQAGLYIIVSPVKNLSMFYWRGWGAGEPNKPRLEVNNFFEAVGAILTLGNLKLSYVYNVFMGEKTALPGVCYAVPINSKFKFFAGCDYKVISKEPLFRIGISYFPK